CSPCSPWLLSYMRSQIALVAETTIDHSSRPSRAMGMVLLPPQRGEMSARAGVVTGDAACQELQSRPMLPLILIFGPGQPVSGGGNACDRAMPDGRETHAARVFIGVEIDQLASGGFVRVVLILVFARCEE